MNIRNLALFLLKIQAYQLLLNRYTLEGDNFIWARMFYSVTAVLYFSRFMHVFYVQKNIGPKVIMIRRMVSRILHNYKLQMNPEGHLYACLFGIVCRNLVMYGFAYNELLAHLLLKSITQYMTLSLAS